MCVICRWPEMNLGWIIFKGWRPWSYIIRYELTFYEGVSIKYDWRIIIDDLWAIYLACQLQWHYIKAAKGRGQIKRILFLFDNICGNVMIWQRRFTWVSFSCVGSAEYCWAWRWLVDEFSLLFYLNFVFIRLLKAIGRIKTISILRIKLIEFIKSIPSTIIQIDSNYQFYCARIFIYLCSLHYLILYALQRILYR